MGSTNSEGLEGRRRPPKYLTTAQLSTVALATPIANSAKTTKAIRETNACLKMLVREA